MADEKTWLRKVLRGRLRAFVRRAPAASAYLVTGVVIGIVASQLWDLPARLNLLGEGLFGPAGQVLELVVSEGPVTPSSLPEFGGLQQELEPSRRPGSGASPSPSVEPVRALPTVAAPPVVAAPAPAPGPGSPEGVTAQLLGEISSRLAEARGTELRTGSVVQVASYTDARSADALAVRLQRQGFDSFVMKSEESAPSRFRVRVQPRGETSGSALAQRLRELGFSVWVTRQ